MPLLTGVARLASRLVRRPDGGAPRQRLRARARGSARSGDYPGDFTGAVTPEYSPELDGDPDPGEIVWAWVPFEEDHSRGKDRPVLVVGRDGPWLLALMLSSRDHDTRPGHPGEDWIDLGAGDWDARRRPSEVRVDRVVRLAADAVRREGAMLDRQRFDQVVGSLRQRGGW